MLKRIWELGLVLGGFFALECPELPGGWGEGTP